MRLRQWDAVSFPNRTAEFQFASIVGRGLFDVDIQEEYVCIWAGQLRFASIDFT